MKDVFTVVCQQLAQLRSKGAIDVEVYEQKLNNNANDENNLKNHMAEGRAALLFLNNGFTVKMRESPDLEIAFNGETVYVEVKRFRPKEQDILDEKAMEEQARKYRNSGNEEDNILVAIGDTAVTEGKPVWAQMADVAQSKVGQYREDAPNILIIESDSDSTEATLTSAAHEVEDRIHEGQDARLHKLNAMILINCGLYTVGRDGPYNVEFCLLATGMTQMSHEIGQRVATIKLG
ncbi:MAG: hypothetical protein WC566_10220 [Dehalococcoidia bacterium]